MEMMNADFFDIKPQYLWLECFSSMNKETDPDKIECLGELIEITRFYRFN